MGSKKILLPLSLVISAISAVLNIIPFVVIYYIIRNILGNPEIINVQYIMKYALLAFVSTLGALIMYFVALLCSHLAAFRVEIGMQKVGMQKILDLPLGFFNINSSGKIRKIISEGASTTHTFLAHQLPDLAGTVISPVALIVLIITIDWRMGLASLVPIIMGFFIMNFMMSSKGKKFQELYYIALEEMSAEAVEYIRGIPVVKTFDQTIFSFKKFYNSITNYKKMVLAYTLLWRTPMSFYVTIMQSATFFIIPMAILLIGGGNSIPLVITNFIFYILISPIFTTLLMRTILFRQNITIAEQAIDKFDKLLDYQPINYKHESTRVNKFDIEFRNVSFTYEGTNKPAVNNISFKIDEGETVALVGASGGGKTTIARLVARFWEVDTGEVLIGGINIKELSKKDLMDTISFVFQSTKLFKGSLKENILLSKTNASYEDINNALVNSQSADIISAATNGLDTVIGSKGTYLSGGEQQRIALARAMIKDSPIVLLDEATAFTDPENEHLIQKALRELGRNKTTLIIAHRLSSVVNVDKILVIDKGEIIEMGNHNELYNKGGVYADMWDEYKESITWKFTNKEVVEKGGQYA